MKILSIFILILSFISGCSNQKNLTSELKNIEKEKIKSKVEAFLKAYEKKDMDEIISNLSDQDEFSFFGSDISEMGGSKAEFQNQMDMDWKLFENINFSNTKIFSTIISNDGSQASSLLETTFNAVISGTKSTFTFRAALTFTNEEGIWKITQALFTVPSVGQSSAELIQKLQNKTQ